MSGRISADFTERCRVACANALPADVLSQTLPNVFVLFVSPPPLSPSKKNTRRGFEITTQVPQFTFHCSGQLKRPRGEVRSWSCFAFGLCVLLNWAHLWFPFQPVWRKPERHRAARGQPLALVPRGLSRNVLPCFVTEEAAARWTTKYEPHVIYPLYLVPPAYVLGLNGKMQEWIILSLHSLLQNTPKSRYVMIFRFILP